MKRIAQSLLTPLALLAFMAPAAYGADIQGTKITLPSTERQVHVTQFKAPGVAPRPSVLLLHGAGGFDRRLPDYNRYASALADQGMDAYLVYYYSDTDDKMMSNGVDVFSSRYAAWAKSVDEMAEYLEKQKDSNGKVGLIGFSNGGILATGAATLDYPPLLVLHGDADQIIPVDAGRELAAEAKQLGAPVDLVIYPGESHGFGADFAKKNATDALNRSTAFLRKELQVK